MRFRAIFYVLAVFGFIWPIDAHFAINLYSLSSFRQMCLIRNFCKKNKGNSEMIAIFVVLFPDVSA